ncbi:unnamed protein product [Pelagomonas calceolata]|uniref:Uncharacterized protein n=1 Tax=Pelagomonas calceolata TaxID=35677 RepID=A0A8J2SIM9_9STRA|nr:unnamed protein product [Pelagomonas calceolata]
MGAARGHRAGFSAGSAAGFAANAGLARSRGASSESESSPQLPSLVSKSDFFAGAGAAAVAAAFEAGGSDDAGAAGAASPAPGGISVDDVDAKEEESSSTGGRGVTSGSAASSEKSSSESAKESESVKAGTGAAAFFLRRRGGMLRLLLLHEAPHQFFYTGVRLLVRGTFVLKNLIDSARGGSLPRVPLDAKVLGDVAHVRLLLRCRVLGPLGLADDNGLLLAQRFCRNHRLVGLVSEGCEARDRAALDPGELGSVVFVLVGRHAGPAGAGAVCGRARS